MCPTKSDEVVRVVPTDDNVRFLRHILRQYLLRHLWIYGTLLTIKEGWNITIDIGFVGHTLGDLKSLITVQILSLE